MEVDVITLGPGDTFVREALPPPLSSSVERPRRHSCITGAAAEVIVVDHNDFQRARDQGCREMTFEQKVQCLRRAAMLKHWDLYRLHRLAYAMQERHYPKDKALATEGTTKDTLVCIVSGTAILHIASDSSAARVAAAQAAAGVLHLREAAAREPVRPTGQLEGLRPRVRGRHHGSLRWVPVQRREGEGAGLQSPDRGSSSGIEIGQIGQPADRPQRRAGGVLG